MIRDQSWLKVTFSCYCPLSQWESSLDHPLFCKHSTLCYPCLTWTSFKVCLIILFLLLWTLPHHFTLQWSSFTEYILVFFSGNSWQHWIGCSTYMFLWILWLLIQFIHYCIPLQWSLRFIKVGTESGLSFYS